MVSNEDPILHDFVTAMVKGNSTANGSHGSHPPTPTKPGPATIKPNSDVCPGASDLGNFPCPLINQSACNIACYANPLCSAFVLHTGTCYLKSCSGPIVPAPGSTVGLLPTTPGRGPPPVSSLQNPVRCSSTAVAQCHRVLIWQLPLLLYAGPLGNQRRRCYPRKT